MSMNTVWNTIQAWCNRELFPWISAGIEYPSMYKRFTELSSISTSIFVLEINGFSVRLADKVGFTRDQLDSDDLNIPELRRVLLYKQFIEKALRLIKANIQVKMCLDIRDRPYREPGVPIFAFQKERDGRALLLPDIDFLGLNFYDASKFTDHLGYYEKHNHAVFVGATTGGGIISSEQVRELQVPRIRSAVHFKGHKDIDFRVPKIVQCASVEVEKMIEALDIGGSSTSWAEQFKSRFLISMDGNGATCSRVAIALKSESVLLKYNSDHVLYFFGGLQPWLHYIPINSDDQIEYILNQEKSQPGLFAYIAEESKKFYKEFLTQEKLLIYTATLIKMYAELFGVVSEAEADFFEQVPIYAVLHIKNRGDVTYCTKDWCGDLGNELPIEGILVSAIHPDISEGLEYQVLYKDGMASDWKQNGEFCGTRGKNRPVKAMRFRLNEQVRALFDCVYYGSFVDGSVIGSVKEGEWCGGEKDIAIRAFQLSFQRK
jgi:hypothetical protein